MSKRNLMLVVVLFALLVASNIAAAQVVTLRFTGWEASPLETASVQRGLERFMELNPNIKVDYTPVAGEYNPKILTMIAGGTAPDVFFIGSRSYRDFVARDVLLDLTPYFEAELELSDFIPSEQLKMLVDDKIYGVSSCTVVSQIYYNKDLFDQAGVPYPPADPAEAWTWDEFVEVAKKMTVVEDGKVVQYGVHGFDANLQNIVAMIFSNEGQMFSEDLTEATFDDPAVIEVLQSILDLRTVHGVASSARFLEQAGMSSAHMLATGRVAMVVDGTWALQELSQMDFEVGIGVLPIFKKPATTDIAHLHVASKATKHPEEAWKLLSFLSSEWYQTDLVSAGLWMPNRTAMYTEEGSKSWINPDVHPEGYEAILPFYTDAIQPYPFLFLPQKAEDLTNEILEYFWYDNWPIEKVVETLNKEINAVISK